MYLSDPSTPLATELFRTKIFYDGRSRRTKFTNGELREEGGGRLSGGQSKKTQIGRYVASVAVRDFTAAAAAIEKLTHSLTVENAIQTGKVAKRKGRTDGRTDCVARGDGGRRSENDHQLRLSVL